MTSDYKKTLNWVNKIRTNFGDPPIEDILLGIQGSNLHCPLAHSIGHQCLVGPFMVTYPTYEVVPSNHRAIRVPRYVRRFIKDFDNGRYADLRMSREELRPPKEEARQEVAVG